MPFGPKLTFFILVLLVLNAIEPVQCLYGYFAGPANRRARPATRDVLVSFAIVLMSLVTVIFLFSPAANDLVKSDQYLPSALAALGFAAVSTTIAGLLSGKVQPWVKGADSYLRREQPKRFWASVVWNIVLGGFLLWGGWLSFSGLDRDRCLNPGERRPPAEAIIACNAILSRPIPADERAGMLRARGVRHHRMGNYAKAISDYSEAIAINRTDRQSIYNRALAFHQVEDFASAIRDYGRLISTDRNDFDALYGRALSYLDSRQFRQAVSDFDIAHRLRPRNGLTIANRGIAHAWLGDARAVDADRTLLRAIDPSHAGIPRMSAILAYQAGDMRTAIAHLSQAIALDPDDTWSLKVRADVYWDLGERDLARDDDDRLAAIKERAAERGWNAAP